MLPRNVTISLGIAAIVVSAACFQAQGTAIRSQTIPETPTYRVRCSCISTPHLFYGAKTSCYTLAQRLEEFFNSRNEIQAHNTRIDRVTDSDAEPVESVPNVGGESFEQRIFNCASIARILEVDAPLPTGLLMALGSRRPDDEMFVQMESRLPKQTGLKRESNLVGGKDAWVGCRTVGEGAQGDDGKSMHLPRHPLWDLLLFYGVGAFGAGLVLATVVWVVHRRYWNKLEKYLVSKEQLSRSLEGEKVPLLGSESLDELSDE